MSTVQPILDAPNGTKASIEWMGKGGIKVQHFSDPADAYRFARDLNTAGCKVVEHD